MAKNLDLKGIQSIVQDYDLFYIDLWGVIHNGIKLHEQAINVLNNLVKMNKDFVLLTNAPRPNNSVKKTLEKMGMSENLRDHVFTSGEAALTYLKNKHSSKNFFHIGPKKDYDLIYSIIQNKCENIDNCDFLLCTGLFEDYFNDLNYYKTLFEKQLEKKMICTNPDLIADRGSVRELCAGSVAMVFEKMGGKVVYFGKPHPEVYNQSTDNINKKILAIGDNLNTDIRGANYLNYHSLLISNGIHRDEIKNKGILNVAKEYEAIVNFIQSDLKW